MIWKCSVMARCNSEVWCGSGKRGIYMMYDK